MNRSTTAARPQAVRQATQQATQDPDATLEVFDRLQSVEAVNIVTAWCEEARDFIGQLQFYASINKDLGDTLRACNLLVGSSEWGDDQTNALQRLLLDQRRAIRFALRATGQE
jgi:hypothetical protein